MKHIKNFPPLTSPHAHTLILGSMPGEASLAAQQYYAHPRNLFWPLLGTILGIDPAQPYAARTAALTALNFAVWDVLASCRRQGSLDAHIDADSVEINNFPPFFAHHPRLSRIFFNGATAEQYFRRYALPRLAPDLTARLYFCRLPSTSPANASIPLAEKTAAWHRIAR